MDSILVSIKKLLGMDADYTAFDTDIIIHINTVLMTLRQIGVGPKEGFSIRGKDEVWSDFVPNVNDLESIKTYVYLKVKAVFDPPLSAAVKESMEKQAAELEWRIYVEVESIKKEEEKIQNGICCYKKCQ
ncbi:hypothetical protein [Anaerostipes sp. PC18]|uniref:phage head-tail connector protein n=1 Tax=Anaerostipes sp. PC18 TaxID=3036926 RepID=UPI00308A99F2|nr:hypothetical protein P8F77_10195 [Anaerostipes sp. PC18]